MKKCKELKAVFISALKTITLLESSKVERRCAAGEDETAGKTVVTVTR